MTSAANAAGRDLADSGKRLLLFLACLPSGGAVLSEVYGVASLHDVVWFAAIPGYAVLVATWLYARHAEQASTRALADAIVIGALGGFLGTIAYDVARIPFVLAGIRVFVPNNTYGLWILDAVTSSRFTNLVGWCYHFANGTCFGIMYAMFMRGRHWAFAIAWAILLETIALISPYGKIYHIVGSVSLMATAYYGHVAYGLPLGFMVARWEATEAFLRRMPNATAIAAAILVAAIVVGALTEPSARDADGRTRPGRFTIEDGRLMPDWLRLLAPGEIAIQNSCTGANEVVVDGRQRLLLSTCEGHMLPMFEPGIHQLYVRREGRRTYSSFVLVEPVVAAR